MKKIGIELFAHINNGYAIAGTRKLEGRSYTETIDYLNSFLSTELDNLLPKASLSPAERQQVETLKARLTSMMEASKEIEAMPATLNQLREARQEYGSPDSKAFYRDFASLLDLLIQRIKSLNPKEADSSILMPGGWSDKPTGHAIAYEFKKDKHGNLIFMLYNSGAGVNYHQTVQHEDKVRYNTMKCYSIPKEALETTWFSSFMMDLVAPQVFPNIEKYKLPSALRNIAYNQDFLYNDVFRGVLKVGGKEIEADTLNSILDTHFNHELSVTQRSGVCAEQSLHELVKHSISNKKTAKIILLTLKLYSIESFLQQNTDPNTGSINAKALLQLQIATRKLSSSLLKKKEYLSPAIYNRALKAITTVSEQAQKPVPPGLHTQSFETLPDSDSLNRKIVNISGRFNSDVPVKPEASEEMLIQKPFNLKPVDNVKVAIDPNKFSINKLSDFRYHINTLVENQFYEDVEQQIFSYMNALPLNKDYFSSIDTPKRAIEYVRIIQDLLSIYAKACEINKNILFNPERLTFTSSALASVDILQSNINLSLGGGGLAAFSNNLGFDYFKGTLQYNAHLSTESRKLDARLKEILSQKNAGKNVPTLNLVELKQYIDKGDAGFKQCLERLYDPKHANVKFTDEEDQLIKAGGYQATIAYLHYLEYDNVAYADYRDEADKMTLFKESIALSKSIQNVMKSFSLESLKEKPVLSKNDKLVVKPPNSNQLRIQYLLSDGIELNTDKTIEYYKKINDTVIQAILNDDFSIFDWSKSKANQIFSLANGKNNENAGSQYNALYQRLRYLRVEPSLQFATTIDFFSDDNLELFSVKKSGSALKSDLQQYLRRNLFQIGLIEAQCKHNPKALESFNHFIEHAIIYFDRDISTQLYFYQLQADVNSYVLDMNAENNPALTQLKNSIEVKQTKLLNEVSTLYSENLTASDQYALSKIKLQLSLEASLRQNKNDPQAHKNLFTLFMDFSDLGRSFEFDCSEQRDAHKRLTQACLNKLLSHESQIYGWALEKSLNEVPDNIKLKLKDLKKGGQYPYFYGVDEKGEKIFALDLTKGQVLISGAYYSYPPGGLMNTALGNECLEGRFPKMSVSICEDLNCKRLVTQYEVVGSNPAERFFESNDLNKPWVYQKEKTVNNKKEFYEKQILSSETKFLDLTLSVNRGSDTTHSLNLELPEYFHGKETTFWLAVNEPNLLIEHGPNRYACDVTKGEIEELDTNNQRTGFSIVAFEQYDWMNFNLFSEFESKEFTQILFKKEPNPEQIKINFPRYNLALEGVRENNQWMIHVAGKPNLRLIPSPVLMKPILKNSLVFEDIESKEQIVYTPNQYYYINKDTQQDRPENEFETVYYNPILDRTNIHKRSIVNLNVPEVDISGEPKAFAPGYATYYGSESFFTYTIDPHTKELKPKVQSSEAQLYLVYNHLIEQRPEEAIKALAFLLKTGGLKGEIGELEVIHKIMHGAPEFGGQINSPEFIAVRAHVLYWCAELRAQKKEFVIPDVTKISSHTPDSSLIKARYRMLETFKSQLQDLSLETLQAYNDIRTYIPSDSDMQLSSKMEYQLLRRSNAKNNENIQIQSRYLDLKREFLRKEKGLIEDIKGPKNQARLDRVEKKLNKIRHLKTEQMALGIGVVPVALPKNRNAVNPNSVQIDKIVETGYAAINLSPDMSDEDFLKQFRSIYSALKRRNFDSKQVIDFLNKMVEAGCLAEKPRSLIPSWAAMLLVMAKQPAEFPEIAFTTKWGMPPNNLDAIFEKASKISSIIAVKTQTYVQNKENTFLEKSIIAKAQDRYDRPEPIHIVGDAQYKLFDHSDFISNTKLESFNNQVVALNHNTKTETDKLKNNLRPKIENQPYVDTIELLSECDEAIGKLKNAEIKEIYACTKQHLANPLARKAIVDLLKDKVPDLNAIAPDQREAAKGWITRLGDLSNNHREAALALANKGPQNEAALAVYRLELQAGHRKKLELGDLNRLFVLADFNEYRKVTGLSDNDITALHNAMAQYMHFSIWQTHYKKIEKEVTKLETLDFTKPENEVQVTEFGQLLSQKNSVSPQDAALQFFQKEEEILIKPMQIEAFNQIVEKNQETGTFNNIVIQLTMGAGKSKVITPTTALKKADGSNLVIQQVKPSLLRVTYADLCEKSARLFNRIPYLLTFERIPLDFKKLPDGQFLSEKYKQIYDDLHDTIIHKNFMLSDGVSLKSLQLQFRETLGAVEPLNESERAEWLKQITQLDKLVQLIEDHGDRMIDEGHDELDPSQELNYTLGLPISVPKEDIELHTNLFFFLPKISLNDIQGIERDKTAYDLILKNSLLTNPAVQISQVTSAIATGLVIKLNDADNPLQYLAAILETADERESMVRYLLNQNKRDAEGKVIKDPLIELVLNKLTDRQKDEVAFLKFDLSKILPFTLLKNYNENFGASRLPGLKKSKKRLAIPYRAIHAPNEKSRFGQPIEALNCTAQLNIIEPLTRDFIEEVIQDYLDRALEERRFSPDIQFEETESSIEFNRLFGGSANTTLKRISDYIKINDEQNLGRIINSLMVSRDVKKSVLVEKSAPEVKINKVVLSSDSQDLGGMSKTTQVMSATPFNYRTYHSSIKFDEVENLGIDGETIELVKAKKTQVKFLENYDSASAALEEALKNCPQALEVRAMMDGGGLFTKEKSNREVAMKIANFYRENPQAASKEIKFVLYFDNDDDTLYAWDVKAGPNQKPILLGSSDEKEIFKILNCHPDERFTFYDQLRITGTDIAQGFKAHAFATFSDKTIESSFLQEIKRLRQFANNQSVTAIGPAFLKGRVEPKIESVLSFVRKNKVDKCLQLHLKASTKKFKDVVRHDLQRKIYAVDAKDPFQKSVLYKKFSNTFLTTSHLKYFEMYGGIDLELKSQEYFENLAKQFYDKWESELKNAGLPILEAEKLTIQKALSDLTKESVLMCSKFISTQPKKEDANLDESFDNEGLEVENQNEVTTELELEKNTTIYDQSLKANLYDSDFVFDSKSYPLKVEVGSYHASLVSVTNSNLFLKDEFNDNLFVSKQQAWTLTNGNADGGRLDTYHNGYVKPIPVVMMIMPKEADKGPLQSVMLTTNEAGHYTKQTPEQLKTAYPNHFVWFVSPNNTPLYGTPPDKLPDGYSNMLEQIRFIDANLRKILQQKELSWLPEKNADTRMKFLKEKILPWFDNIKAKLYKPLTTAIQTALLSKAAAEKLAAEAAAIEQAAIARAALEAAALAKAAEERAAAEKLVFETDSNEAAAREREAQEEAEFQKALQASLAAEEQRARAASQAEIEAAQRAIEQAQLAEQQAREHKMQAEEASKKALLEKQASQKELMKAELAQKQAQERADIEKAAQERAAAERAAANRLVAEKAAQEKANAQKAKKPKMAIQLPKEPIKAPVEQPVVAAPTIVRPTAMAPIVAPVLAPTVLPKVTANPDKPDLSFFQKVKHFFQKIGAWFVKQFNKLRKKPVEHSAGNQNVQDAPASVLKTTEKRQDTASNKSIIPGFSNLFSGKTKDPKAVKDKKPKGNKKKGNN